MKIAFLSSSYATSPDHAINAGGFVHNLAAELIERGHDIHVIAPGGKRSSTHDSSVPVHFIPWLGREHDLSSINIRNPINFIRLATLMISGLLTSRRLIRSLGCEVMLAFWAIPSGFFSLSIWRTTGTPYGVWALGSDIWSRGMYPLGRLVVRAVLKNAAFRFADGINLSKEVEQISGLPCEFVPSVRMLPRTADHRKEKLSPQKTHLLYVGRYEVNKGPDILVQSVKTLIDRGYPLELHLFGTGSMGKHLGKLVTGYENQIHLGDAINSQDLVSYMHSCAWLVIPSRIESIPLILGDAIQARIPIIGTDVGDLGKMIRKFKVGLVSPTPDPEDLAQTIIQAINAKQRKMDPDWTEAERFFDLGRIAEQCEREFIRMKATN